MATLLLSVRMLTYIQMKKTITILLLLFILNSCGQSSQSKSMNRIESEEKGIYKVETYHYDSLTIPLFFKNLVRNHIKDFAIIDSLALKSSV